MIKNHTVKNLILFFVYILLIITLYTFLHEGGHAIIGILGGQKVTEFNINFWDLSAHVSFCTEYPIQGFYKYALPVAGWFLPYILWLVSILFIKKTDNVKYEFIKLLPSIMIISSTLPYIILTVAYELGATISEDSISFLNVTGLSGYFVSGIFTIIIYFSIKLLFHKINFSLFRNQTGKFKEFSYDKN